MHCLEGALSRARGRAVSRGKFSIKGDHRLQLAFADEFEIMFTRRVVRIADARFSPVE
jgi:hypothetical protein